MCKYISSKYLRSLAILLNSHIEFNWRAIIYQIHIINIDMGHNDNELQPVSFAAALFMCINIPGKLHTQYGHTYAGLSIKANEGPIHNIV